MINPHLIGCDAACIDLDVEDEAKKDKALDEIRRIYGVIKILNFRGRGLQVTLYYQDAEALKRRSELIVSICGSSEEPTVWKLPFPRANFRMTITDWKVMAAMLDDARKNLEDVSKSIGLSVRTIERR